jgi:type II secretory pathway pseudopilin PulG
MSNEKGYTYIWMMFAVALAGVALAGGGQAWKTEARREKEKELLFIGEQFRLAIGSYYDQSPGAKRYPESLEKLISDNRFPTVTRHLRKIFHDPMTGAAEWGLITRPGVGVIGVHSLSDQKPLKKANFHERYTSFSGAATYREWKFIYLPGEAGGGASQPQPQSQPGSPFDPKSAGQTQPDPGRPPPRDSSPFPGSPSPSDPSGENDSSPFPGSRNSSNETDSSPFSGSRKPPNETDSSPFSGSSKPPNETDSFFRR